MFMTLIVYKNGELIADQLVVIKDHTFPGIVNNKEILQDKIIITSDNCFAYTFNNDQYPDVVDVVLNYLRLFELKVKKDSPPVPKFDIDFKLMVMSRRHFYTVNHCVKEGIDIKVGDDFTYITPDGAYHHYEVLTLTAEEIFDVLAYYDLFMRSDSKQLVKQSSLNYIKKTKVI